MCNWQIDCQQRMDSKKDTGRIQYCTYTAVYHKASFRLKSVKKIKPIALAIIMLIINCQISMIHCSSLPNPYRLKYFLLSRDATIVITYKIQGTKFHDTDCTALCLQAYGVSLFYLKETCNILIHILFSYLQ